MTNAVATVADPREAALLKAVGFDRLAPEQRALALAIAGKYELDTMLKHLVMIEGRPYITRDGLLHVAHRSGQLDGIETSEPAIIDGFWRASCSVYRKDMSRPFTYTGRYPTQGGNQKYAPEMAVKVAEVMALRRAFDVAAPTAEERWDVPTVDVPASASATAPSLAERAAAKRAELETPATQEASVEPSDETEAAGADSVSGSATALSRLQFIEEVRRAGIANPVVVARSGELFPGIAPKDLSDTQRAVLLADLTDGFAAIDAAAKEMEAALA